MARTLGIVFLALGLVACGSSTDTSPDAPSSSASTGGALPADELEITSAEYTVKPGEEIKYTCFTMNLPKDKETILTEVEPLYGKATHHMAVYSTLTPEQEGTFSCPQLFKTTWIPVYEGGVDSGTLTLPEGTGMHLKAGQQIVVQLHLLNATDAPVTDKASIIFHTTDDASVTPAGVWGMTDMHLKIPAQSTNFEQHMGCAASNDMNVFAVLGHMHQLGSKLELSRGANAGDEVLYQEKWDFNNQPTTPMEMKVNKGDNLHLQCWYNNDTSNEVDYGESSLTEMCAFIFYYTPYAGLGGCEG